MKKRIRNLTIVTVLALILAASGLITLLIPTKGESPTQFRPVHAFQSRNWGTEANNDHQSGLTAENPFRIGSAATLNLAATRTMMAQTSRHFVLVDDIDLSEVTGGIWAPINSLGTSSVFDGNFHTIANLRITSGSDIGLFRMVSGTVKNFTMTDVDITTVSGVRVAAVAGTTGTGSHTHFENIILEGGTITGTGTSHSIGGILGAPASSGTVNIHACFNNIDIDAAYFIGGIVGHSTTGSTRIYISHAGNTGNMTARSLSFGYVGGIMGLNEGSTRVEIDYSFNRGEIRAERRDVGGILGSAWSGTAIIRNSFNDAPIIVTSWSSGNVGAVVGYRNATNPTVVNSFFNSETLGWVGPQKGSFSNATADAATHGEDTAFMRSQALVDALNPAPPADPVFVLGPDGLPTLVVFQRDTQVIYTFSVGTGQGTVHTIIQLRNADSDEFDVMNPITLPSNDTEDYTLPTKDGYVFSGWEWTHPTTNVVYVAEAGSTFQNPIVPGESINFTAVYTPAEFHINQDGGEGPFTVSGSLQTVNIQNSTVTLTFDGVWTPTLVWQVLTVNNTWEVIGENNGTLQLGQIINERGYEFFQTHGIRRTGVLTPYYLVGDLYFRVQDTEDFRVINVVTNIEGAGTFNLTHDGNVIPVELRTGNGVRIMLDMDFPITNWSATQNQHFDDYAAVITLRDPSDDIQNISFPIGLGAGGINAHGWTIEVNFTKNEYDFNVVAKHMINGNFVEIPDVFDSLVTPTISINLDGMTATVLNITADLEITHGTSTFRFVTWLIYNNYRDIYEPLFHVNGELNADFLTNSLWLADYLNGHVLIVAEYVETFQVNISIAGGQDDHGIVFIETIDGESITHSGSVNARFARGSHITITAIPGRMFEIDQIWDNINNEGFEVEEFEITDLDGDVDMSVRFKNRQFEFIFYRGLVTDTTTTMMPILDGNMFEVMFGEPGVARANIQVGDWLAGINEVQTIAGHNLKHFEIRDNQGNVLLVIDGDFAGKTMDEAFLNAALDRVTRFAIVAVYQRVYVLNIGIAAGDAPFGSFQVFHYGETEATTDREFAFGDRVTVVVTAIPNYHFVTTNTMPGSTFTFTITADRTISLRFAPTPKTVTPYLTTKGNGELTSDREAEESLVIYQTITLTATPGFGQEIRSWTLFGESLGSFGVNDITRVSDTQLVVTLNARILGLITQNQGQLISEVEFGITFGMIMMIVVPSALLLLLIAFLIFYYISLNKKKRVIKAMMTEDLRNKIVMNTGDFISGLRDGTETGQVTDEDVKKAMKDKKKPKK